MNLKTAVIILLVSALLSCQHNAPPEQVAKLYWNAIQNQDKKTVSQYSTDDLSKKIQTFSFSQIVIDGDKSEVETIVRIKQNGREDKILLTTFLSKKDKKWFIESEKTLSPLLANSKTNSLEELTKKISKNMKHSVENFINNYIIPELEPSLNAAEKELQQKLPKIKENIREFLRENLDKFLQDKKEKEPLKKEQAEGEIINT